MNQAEFDRIMESAIAEAKKILCKKGQDYTRVGSNDRLDNFKSIGAITGLSPLQVWAVLISKQFLALMQYVSAGSLHSESVEERFSDTLNYLFLGRAIISEKRIESKETASAIKEMIELIRTCPSPDPQQTGIEVIKNLTESPYPNLETVEPKPIPPADQVTVFAV